jgi:hypothetical protein
LESSQGALFDHTINFMIWNIFGWKYEFLDMFSKYPRS